MKINFEPTTKNPWKKLSSKIIYKDPWVTLREDRVVRPDRTRGVYGVVDLKGAVKVIAMTPKKEIYLVGQWRYVLNKFSWELPGGSVENRKFLRAAKNELKEEAVLEAKCWKFIGIGYECVGVVNQKVKFYLATNLTKTTRKIEGSEKGMKIIKTPIQEAANLILQNKIFDGSTIVGIFKVIEYHKRI